MLTTRSLQFQYPSGSTLHFPDMECAAGENILLLGESGTGKTTLLHMLAGILNPQQGEIRYGEHAFHAMRSSLRDRFRGLHMGMVFQKHYFIEGLSVYDNLLAAQQFAGNKPDKKHLDQLMRKLGINALAHKPAHELSQGEQQRFSIARALANRPRWVLADEPTSSLDDRNCEHFAGLMAMDLTGNAVSWIVATHDQRIRNHFTQVYKL